MGLVDGVRCWWMGAGEGRDLQGVAQVGVDVGGGVGVRPVSGPEVEVDRCHGAGQHVLEGKPWKL